jgi:hypothetical protein
VDALLISFKLTCEEDNIIISFSNEDKKKAVAVKIAFAGVVSRFLLSCHCRCACTESHKTAYYSPPISDKVPRGKEGGKDADTCHAALSVDMAFGAMDRFNFARSDRT